LHSYQQQVQDQNTPAKLFEKVPILPFKPERETCPIDGQPLHVQKTHQRTIKAIGIGVFKAHHTVLCCKRHRELGSWRSTELAALVPSHNNVAYSVLVEVGKLRFRESRQVEEIQEILLQQHSVDISTSEIERLIDKFIFYLDAVHQESTELIKEHIKMQGGYILHVDSTCDGDSPKLASSLDSESGFVLYSAKLNTENKDEIVSFLKQIKQRFGSPHAVVSDMSQGIQTAVRVLFEHLPHYICHFHFLKAIGILLFEKEHTVLRKALSKVGISGQLKNLTRTIAKSFDTLAADAIEDYLAAPEQLGKTCQATGMLAYYLMLWILDHASEGHGYGFPFDQRYLNFYERLQTAQTLIDEVKTYYPAKTDNDTMIWKLYHLIEKVVGDRALQDTVAQYKIKLDVFSDLRQALGIAPESTNNGLTNMPVPTSSQELQRIKIAVEHFMRSLDQQIHQTNDREIRTSLTKVKERLTTYGDKLFADPIVVEVKGEKKQFFVHRTNNIMEHHFRRFNYRYRRIHGNHSVRRNLEHIPEQLPLVENLNNPDYIKLVFQNESKIAKRFSEIDAKTIQELSKENCTKKKSLCSRQVKRVLRHDRFKQRLIAAFAAVAG
jgi:hypothetical protein